MCIRDPIKTMFFTYLNLCHIYRPYQIWNTKNYDCYHKISCKRMIQTLLIRKLCNVIAIIFAKYFCNIPSIELHGSSNLHIHGSSSSVQEIITALKRDKNLLSQDPKITNLQNNSDFRVLKSIRKGKHYDYRLNPSDIVYFHR